MADHIELHDRHSSAAPRVLAAAAGASVLLWAIFSGRTSRVAGDRGLLSYRSRWSVLSASSILSVGSAVSLLSIGSFASVLSIGSSNSVLSIGSDGGFLSIGRRGSARRGDHH